MPAINVSSSQYDRFSKFATPFVDTHETTFEKILTLAEGSSSPVPATTNKEFGLTSLPDMKHTTVTGVEFDGKEIGTAYWNYALVEFLRVAKKHGSVVDMAKTLPVNVTASKKTAGGYTWYQDLGVSVQGLAATGVAKTILSIAERYGIRVRIDFYWQDKPEAMHPGQRGTLVAN